MNLTDKIYLIETGLNIFGDIVPTEETMMDCRVMSRQIISGNAESSSVENRYEIKIYIPYRRMQPYSNFGEKKNKFFRFENVVYELEMKITAKDFFGKIHHYELSLREYKDAEI